MRTGLNNLFFHVFTSFFLSFSVIIVFTNLVFNVSTIDSNTYFGFRSFYIMINDFASTSGLGVMFVNSLFTMFNYVKSIYEFVYNWVGSSTVGFITAMLASSVLFTALLPFMIIVTVSIPLSYVLDFVSCVFYALFGKYNLPLQSIDVLFPDLPPLIS